MTAQDCAIESMRHSSLAAEPSGVPSSKNARRYQSPSQPSRSSATFSASTCSRQRARALDLAALLSARPANSLRGSCGGTSRATRSRPRRPRPTRFMPSFQSPVPISGRPWRPTARLRSSARAQCSKRDAVSRGDLRLEIPIDLLRLERRRREEGHRLVEHAAIAGDLDVVVRRVGEPEQVVGDPGAHAPAVRGRATSAGRPPLRTAARPRAAGARAPARAARP